MGQEPSAAKAHFEAWLDHQTPGLLRWRYIAISTLGLALSGVAVGALSGWWKLIPVAFMLLFGGLSATIIWARDRAVRVEKRRAAEASHDSEELAAKLMASVCGGGQPLIATLGDIAGGSTQIHGVEPASAMVARVLAAARHRVGVEPSDNRAVFIRVTDHDTLQFVLHDGRDSPPRRREWTRSDGALGRDMLEFAFGNGTPYQDYPDLLEKAPPGFGNPAEASYRSFVTTRVMAGPQVLGLLCVDSPRAENFTGPAKQVLLLLAGILGAGLAMAHFRREVEGVGVPSAQGGGTAGSSDRPDSR